MRFKCNKSSGIFKKIFAWSLILGINTYGFNTSFSQEQDPSPDSLAFYNEVMAKVESVKDASKQVGTFDPSETPSLPIGLAKTINGNDYIICIDSAYWLKDGAYFSAYMAIELPNSDKPLAFAAKNIKFNPKGVVGGNQARLQLVSEHLIEMGPNTKLRVPGDGSNYVEWNCNGFESVNLHGFFLMSDGILIPKDGKPEVTAEFEVNVEDVNNMMAQVSFSPFAVKGLENVDFTVSDASVDMSDYSNPPGVTLPSVYNELYPEDINLWRGFHIQYFEVKLPEELSAHDQRTEIYAQNLFIDDAGVTGSIGANNVLALGDSDSEWSMSVDNIQLGFTTNSLTSGSIEGEIGVPFLDNNKLEYEACVTKNSGTNKADYDFTVSTTGDMSVSAFNSKLTIDNSSYLSMTIIEGKFDPSLHLNGKWTLDDPKGNFSGISFQNVGIVTQAPYLSSGQFSLVSNPSAPEPDLNGFNLTLTQLQLGIYQGKITLGVGALINLGDNVAVGGGFKVMASVEENPSTGKLDWSFDSFRVDSIVVDIQTSSLYLVGGVYFRYGDPIYGDGFQGSLAINICEVFSSPLTLSAIFGNVNGYKYFAIDAGIPVNIPLGSTGAYLTQISGGVSYHMEDSRTPETIMEQAKSGTSSSALSPTFTPNSNIGLGFRAGVQFKYTPEKTLNGDIEFSVYLNANGGLESILLAGEAYMMVTRAERAGAENYVRGTVAVGYNNSSQTFDMQMSATAQFAGAIYANIWSQLYISPSLWFFHLGTPQNQCTATVVGLATVNAYFMFGQNLPGMPPPPPQVLAAFPNVSSGRDNSVIASGDGIATGMNFQIGFDETVGITEKWFGYGSGIIGAGFDLSLLKYSPTYYCSGAPGPFGANYWYCQGQLYAYGSIGAGARKIVDGEIKREINLINGSMAMLIQGKFPKPAYVYGGLNLHLEIFKVINVNFTVDFEAGTDCQIVSN